MPVKKHLPVDPAVTELSGKAIHHLQLVSEQRNLRAMRQENIMLLREAALVFLARSERWVTIFQRGNHE